MNSDYKRKNYITSALADALVRDYGLKPQEASREAKQALDALVLEVVNTVIGGNLGGRFYSTRLLKEQDGLTAINNFKAELRQKAKELINAEKENV